MKRFLERNISEKIRKLLEEQGIRRKPFAEKNGLYKGNFYRMLSGKRGWTLDNLEKVANGLGVALQALFNIRSWSPWWLKLTEMEWHTIA